MATTGQDQNAAGAPYRIEPVKPTGTGTNRRIQLSELAPDEEVIGIMAYDVLTSHLVDAGSGGRMAFRGDNDKHSVQLETVWGVMAKACMELARKMEVAQNSLFSICNCSADPTSMQGRAMNPNMELDGENELEGIFAELAGATNEKTVKDKHMAVYKNAELMREIHAAMNDTVATSEAFKRMIEVQRGLSASRIDFNLVFRPTPSTSLDTPPPPNSTGSLMLVVQLICNRSMKQMAPSLEDGLDLMLKNNRANLEAERKNAQRLKERGMQKAAKEKSMARPKIAKAALLATDPVENIYREVYPLIVNNIMTKHNYRLLHPALRSFLKVRTGQKPVREHLDMIKMTKATPIMFPVLARNGHNQLVEKTNSSGGLVYEGQVMDLRMESHYDPLFAITNGNHAVADALRDPLNYNSDEHMDSLQPLDLRECGSFRTNLKRLKQVVDTEQKPWKENLFRLKLAKNVAKENNDNDMLDRITTEMQTYKLKIRKSQQVYTEFYNSVFENPEFWKYGMCLSTGNSMDGCLETGAMVFRVVFSKNHFQNYDPECIALSRLSPDPVFLFNTFQQAKRDVTQKINPNFSLEVNPGPSTIHKECLLQELVQTVTDEHLTTEHTANEEPRYEIFTDLCDTTFLKWARAVGFNYQQMREQQYQSHVKWEPMAVFEFVQQSLRQLWDSVMTNTDTCKFTCAIRKEAMRHGVFGLVPAVQSQEAETGVDRYGNSQDLLKFSYTDYKKAGSLKVLAEKKDVLFEEDDATGVAGKIQELDRMHYVQMQENLKRVRAIGGKDMKKENISGFIKRVPQTYARLDMGVCCGQNTWQEVVMKYSKGKRLLASQRMVSFLVRGILRSFNPRMDVTLDHLRLSGDVAAGKSMAQDTSNETFGEYHEVEGGQSEKGHLAMAPRNSTHVGYRVSDEQRVHERAIMPGEKGMGGAEANQKGEEEKSAMVNGLRTYKIGTVIQDAEGHNRPGTNIIQRHDRTMTLGATNDNARLRNKAFDSRTRSFVAERIQLPGRTEANYAADTPAANSNTALYQANQLDEAKHIVWQCACPIYFLNALVEAGVIPSTYRGSGLYIQRSRDDLLARRGEDVFGFRTQEQASNLAETNCFIRIATRVFRDVYGPGSEAALKIMGQEKFEPADFFNRFNQTDVAALMYTDFQDDLSATMACLTDTRLEDERLVQEAIITHYLHNGSSMRDFADMVQSSHPGAESFEVDLHYIKVPVNVNSKEPRNALLAIAKQIAPKISRNKEKYTDQVVCDILMGLVNDSVGCVVRYPAMLDAYLPGLTPNGCRRTIMSVMTKERIMKEHSKSANPEVRALDKRAMATNRLSPDDINAMGRQWMEGGYNVIYGEPGAEYFPSTFMHGTDAHFNRNLLSSDFDKGDGYVTNKIFDLSQAMEQKMVKINTFWLLQGMFRMQSNESNRNLPSELMHEMAGPATVSGPYVHEGIGMSDINRLAPHAFSCSMINPEDDNSVQAVINTNYCGQQGISNAKARKVPQEMQSHNKTMSPNYPESLQHCSQRQEELVHWGPEHKVTERLLLWADSHGERIACTGFIAMAETECIMRCLEDEWTEYDQNNIEVATPEDMAGLPESVESKGCATYFDVYSSCHYKLKQKMQWLEFEEVLGDLFRLPPEKGGLLHFARDYLMAADLEVEEDENGQFVPATVGRVYDNSTYETTKAEARIMQLTLECWHQYTGPAEGSFTFSACEHPDRQQIANQIQFHVDSFNNGGYHPTEVAPRSWDAAPYQYQYTAREIGELPSDIGKKRSREGQPRYNMVQRRQAAYIRHHQAEMQKLRTQESVLKNQLSEELGVDISQFGPTYYDSRLRNPDNRCGESHYPGYLMELERLARHYHIMRKVRWSSIGIRDHYKQNTNVDYDDQRLQLLGDHVHQGEDLLFLQKYQSYARESALQRQMREDDNNNNNNNWGNQPAYGWGNQAPATPDPYRGVLAPDNANDAPLTPI